MLDIKSMLSLKLPHNPEEKRKKNCGYFNKISVGPLYLSQNISYKVLLPIISDVFQ
jgi:hypothetical protein